MVRKFWLPSKKYQMQTGELLRESSEPADFKGASADGVEAHKKYKASRWDLSLHFFVIQIAARGPRKASSQVRDDLLDGGVRDAQKGRVCDDEDSGGAESEPEGPARELLRAPVRKKARAVSRRCKPQEITDAARKTILLFAEQVRARRHQGPRARRNQARDF